MIIGTIEVVHIPDEEDRQLIKFDYKKIKMPDTIELLKHIRSDLKKNPLGPGRYCIMNDNGVITYERV